MQSIEVGPDGEGEVQREVKHVLCAEALRGELLPVLVVVETSTRWDGKFLPQRLDDCARSHHFAHRNRMNPDAGFSPRPARAGGTAPNLWRKPARYLPCRINCSSQ